MAIALPPIETLPQLSKENKIKVLDHLFEPCPTLQSLLLPELFSHSFTDYRAFIEAARSLLISFLETASKDDPRIFEIIAAHPRLGAPKPGQVLSVHSSAEQKSLQGTSEEQARLAQLNQEYEKTFPGLRYVVFVNGRSRAVIMQDMVNRIEKADIELEKQYAFQAMCDIALDRAAKLGAKL